MKANSSNAEKQLRRSNKHLILVVDNDSDNLLFARYIIESLGMICLVSNDSRQALSLIYDFLPNLVLLDIVMPDLNGIEIAYKIRQDKNIQTIPIIAVTGLTREKEKKVIYEAGFDDYICKPYLIEEMETKISLFLGKVR